MTAVSFSSASDEKKKEKKKKPNVWRSDRSTKLTQSLPYDTGISFVLTSSFSTHFGVMGKKNENFHELKKNFFVSRDQSS